MKLAPQSKPYTPRQIARLFGVALTRIGWLTESQLHDALASDHQPKMLVNVADPTGPNGMRSFIIEVREVS